MAHHENFLQHKTWSSGGPGQESSSAGLIPTAMLSSMFGRMMPDALEKLKDEAPRAARKTNGQ